MEHLFLNEQQETILKLQKAYPQSGICNIGGIVKLEKEQDYNIQIEAFQYMLKHIPMLKLQFNYEYEPYLSEKEVVLKKWFLESEPSMEKLSEWLSVPFSFFKEPLCDIRYCLKDETVEFYIKVHHILLDGYSIALWARKFFEIYQAMKQGEKCPELSDDGFTETMFQRQKVSDRDMEWLKKQISFEHEESWRLKTIHPGKIKASRKIYNIPNDLYNKMKKVERIHGFSAEVLLTAALGIYISKVTGSQNVVLGRSLVNRRKKEMSMLGTKVNVLPVTMKLDKENNFFKFCEIIRGIFYDMMCHSAAPFQQYLEKEHYRELFYDIMISYRSEKYIPVIEGIEQIEIPGLELELPMRIFLNEFSEEMRIEIKYQISCYEEQEIQAFWERILVILNQGLENKKVQQISVLSHNDIMLWKTLNETDYMMPDFILPEKIQKQCNNWKNRKSAVVLEDERISYQELDEQATTLASWLVEEGVLKGDIIGVQMQSSVLLPIVFYGIWKAGASFLPIETNLTDGRMKKINTICKKILTKTDVEIGVGFEKRVPLPKIQPDMIAYYMFTSGSTGEPKVVMISHQSLACRLAWMETRYQCADRVLQKAYYTFDVSMWEYFLSLMEGGTLFLTRDEERGNPKRLLELLKRYQIRTVHFVPSLLSVFLKYVENKNVDLPSLEHVFSSGEVLAGELVEQFYRIFPNAKLHNLYGPTECTIDVTYYDCIGTEKQVPIGKPVFWTKAEVLNKYGECVPPGIEGQLSIRGALVGEGYYQTASEAYRRDVDTLERIYDTGDRALLGMDGQLYYKGRNDRQCKINGIRVNLGEIEAVMLQCSGVLRAAVLKKENCIFGFYMAHKPIPELKEKMLENLPGYSVPQQIFYLEDIPLTRNGKTDKKYLEQYLNRKLYSDTLKLPTTKEEEIVHKCLVRKIGHVLSVEENIFLAGLDSLSLMEVIVELEESGLEYTPEDFYEYLTIKAIVKNGGKGCQWLHRANEENIVIAFPYAAGTADVYQELAQGVAEFKMDFCVVRDAQKLPDVTRYKKIVLLGYCIGTVTALEALEIMHQKGKKVCGMVLCAALPPGKILRKTGSPWKRFSDKEIALLLEYLHGKKMQSSEARIQRFRKETDRFFAFFSRKYHMECEKVFLCFGEKDPLTKGSGKKWKRWLKYLSGTVEVHIWTGEKHFFLEQRKEQLILEICKMIEEGV